MIGADFGVLDVKTEENEECRSARAASQRLCARSFAIAICCMAKSTSFDVLECCGDPDDESNKIGEVGGVGDNGEFRIGSTSWGCSGRVC